jgi:hypothetical protein
MSENQILIATCGSEIAVYASQSEMLLSDAGAFAVAEELVLRLSVEALQLLGVRIQERLCEGLGHAAGHC